MYQNIDPQLNDSRAGENEISAFRGEDIFKKFLQSRVYRLTR
jgi:hypothetical protein